MAATAANAPVPPTPSVSAVALPTTDESVLQSNPPPDPPYPPPSHPPALPSAAPPATTLATVPTTVPANGTATVPTETSHAPSTGSSGGPTTGGPTVTPPVDAETAASLARYTAAAATIGTAFQSQFLSFDSSNATGDPRTDFVTDHDHFMHEIGYPFRLRRLGGSELDVYGLYRAVLERGGLQAVIYNRAFKMVAKALTLPKTCTSAAFILRSEYEKLLYAYEQRHVWGRAHTDLPELIQVDRRKSLSTRSPSPLHTPNPNDEASANPLPTAIYTPQRVAANVAVQQPSPAPAPLQPTPAAAIHPLQTRTSTRPRRHAAQAASQAFAAAAVADDPYAYPFIPRRSRLTGLDENSIDTRDEALLEDEIGSAAATASLLANTAMGGATDNAATPGVSTGTANQAAAGDDGAPHALYVPGQQAERDRVVAALQSPLSTDVAWALGTLNALSFDVRNFLDSNEFPHLLDSLHGLLFRHMEDVLGRRALGADIAREEEDVNGPRDAPLSAMDVRFAGASGEPGGHPISSASGGGEYGMRNDRERAPSLQVYGDLFNVSDGVAIDRAQFATVATNVLRNMSFFDRNAIALSNATSLMNLSAAIMVNIDVGADLRDGLMDMWINVSPYLNASKGHAGHVVLKTCVELLDPFRLGADKVRFANCGEVLARLSASPERNESVMTDMLSSIVPRVVDMLAGRYREYMNAGLALLCNLSAFDWPARDYIARAPLALDRLLTMLSDPEMAPRAAVTLLNLAESPSNRSVLMVYERRLSEFAMTPSPASETVASVLFELDND